MRARKPLHGVTAFRSADLYRDPRSGLEVGCDLARAGVFLPQTFRCGCGFPASATTERTLAEAALTHACAPVHDECA